MKKIQVKVCGITDAGDLAAIARQGADMLGMIFFPPSVRFAGGAIDLEAMRVLRLSFQDRDFTGVFVDADKENVRRTAEEFQLNALQFHGYETPEYCRSFMDDYTVIKAISISGEKDFDSCFQYAEHCHFFLFDTAGPLRGGNGKSWDWDLLAFYSGNTPFLISGGISPEDVGKLRSLNHPLFVGVDINSRFELDSGKKNIEAIVDFVKALNSEVYEVLSK